MIINEHLLNETSAKAKASPRLRMNYNFHQSLENKCHRFLNAVEPGTVVEIHRHPTKDETFVLLRGRVVVNTYNDDGTVKESVELCPTEGKYGVNIPKGIVVRLREFMESEARSCSMDPGCITPEYVYRMWGGTVSLEDIKKTLALLKAE